MTVCGELHNKAPPLRSAEQGTRGPGLGGRFVGAGILWRGNMGGSVVWWPEGRLVAAKVRLAVLASGLEGRAAGGADVIVVEAARPTEAHPVRETITDTG